ncbi:MAG: hypothetical protein ACD_50C00143G0010 [uncultured bacterium]|nr:MAG: hypothetical protein ACD_50C00143G0010 [uncultured bacterium]
MDLNVCVKFTYTIRLLRQVFHKIKNRGTPKNELRLLNPA